MSRGRIVAVDWETLQTIREGDEEWHDDPAFFVEGDHEGDES